MKKIARDLPADFWQHLHWLCVLAQQGSFTAAAVRLGVSKAAMSQRIAELERMARVMLVQRTTRSVRLTEAGQRLVDDTRASFDHIAHSFEQARDLAEVPSGLLRVTAPVAFARQQLAPRLSGFFRAYPQVRMELDMSDRLSSLATEGFDLAIRHTASPPDTHVAWTLCKTQSVLVASKPYLRRAGTPQTPEELQHHDCLHYLRAQATQVWTFQRLGKARHKDNPISVPLHGPLAANNSEALREAALSGLGIALLPDFSAQLSLQQGKLVRVLPEWAPVGAFAEQLYAIRPYAAHPSRAVTAFVNYLRQTFAKGFDAKPDG